MIYDYDNDMFARGVEVVSLDHNNIHDVIPKSYKIFYRIRATRHRGVFNTYMLKNQIGDYSIEFTMDECGRVIDSDVFDANGVHIGKVCSIFEHDNTMLFENAESAENEWNAAMVENTKSYTLKILTSHATWFDRYPERDTLCTQTNISGILAGCIKAEFGFKVPIIYDNERRASIVRDKSFVISTDDEFIKLYEMV